MDSTSEQNHELMDRLRASDASPVTVTLLHETVLELCCQYGSRRATDLRVESRRWLELVESTLRRPTGTRAHSELLTAAGWLSLVAGCVEYDLGSTSAAEVLRSKAQQLGREAGHPEILGWAHEMSAWFALTQGRHRDAITAARAGRELGVGSVQTQLLAQEAKARARLGETRLEGLLERGRTFLDRLPPPTRPDNHFTVDPAKLDLYAMDVHRWSHQDDLASRDAEVVLRRYLHIDGSTDAPMRVTEARLTLATVAARKGELEQAVEWGLNALSGERKSLPSLLMVAGELGAELRRRYPREALTRDFEQALRSL